MWLGGHLEKIGLPIILLLQAACFALGAGAARQMPPMPPAAHRDRPDLLAGIKATWRTPLIRNIIGLNFLSSLANAGAYIVAIPFIVKQVYHGDAALFSSVMVVFTAGSIGSNVVLLRFMPLLRPGRLFLLMQLTRVIILGTLWINPAQWLFYIVMFGWGFNMGVTSTLVQTTVQELASGIHRAQILSVLLVSFMVSAPLSSMLLGNLIALYDPLTALIPAIVISLVIFAIGVTSSGLWRYQPEGGQSTFRKRYSDPVSLSRTYRATSAGSCIGMKWVRCGR